MNVSKKHTASIITVEKSIKWAKKQAVSKVTFSAMYLVYSPVVKIETYVPPKRQYIFTRLHGVTYYLTFQYVRFHVRQW
jgi:hypothetical protein